MPTENKKHTPWKFYSEHGTQYRIRAEYGFTHFQGQTPYWSVTGTIDRKERGAWRDDAGGQIVEDITKHFPELVPTLRWHLCHVPEGPMHYLANGKWWWEHYIGARIVDRSAMRNHANSSEAGLAYFKSTVVFGALPDDELPKMDASIGAVQEWMKGRIPRLMEAFRRDIDALDPSLWPAQS